MVSHVNHGVAARERARSTPPENAAGVATHMLAAVMVLFSVLFLAWVRVSSLHLGYELGRLRAEQDALLQDNRALQVEAGTLRSPAQLQNLARRLNMVPPQASSVVEGGTP
jgi:cell division protein FtsL